jgi:hypothetical protein
VQSKTFACHSTHHDAAPFAYLKVLAVLKIRPSLLTWMRKADDISQFLKPQYTQHSEMLTPVNTLTTQSQFETVALNYI